MREPVKGECSSALAYRPEIDGLRAVAVLAVCLFHAGFPGVGGGFVGVDVFFVISGYLITGIIQSGLGAGSFSIADFYARRARRILPALFAVLGATAVLGYFLMLPGELKMLGRHIAATALFVSNIAFFSESGYFDLSAELKPLLMTWSLGVEEQFYIIWPLLLWLAVRWRIRPLVPVAVLLLLSLAGASWAVREHPAGTFFLLPSRAWELALGALVALRPAVAGGWSWRSELAGGLGLLAILAAVLGYGPTTLFPAYGALLPCVGALLILIAGTRSRCNVLLLCSPPMRWVGRISYSLYLWHWPLFAFARLLLNGELPLPVASGLLLLAFVLAQLSWQLIEQPWRHAGQSVPGTLRAYGLCLLVTLFGALAVIGVSKAAWRTGPEVRRIDAFAHDINPLQRLCHLDDAAVPEAPDSRCRQGTGGQALFLWGDSHADALSPGMAEWAAKNGYAFTQFTKSGCPPLPGLNVNDSRGGVYENCRRFNQSALDYIRSQPAIGVVVLDARWSIYSEPRHGVERNKPDVVLARPGEGFVTPATARANLAAALGEVVSELRALGKRIILVTQPPDPGFNVPQCWARRSMLGAWTGELVSCAVERAVAWGRIEPANAIVRAVASGRAGVGLLDAAGWLCPDAQCVTKDAARDEILYFDDDHLSRSAARLLADRMVLPAFGEWPPENDSGKEVN